MTPDVPEFVQRRRDAAAAAWSLTREAVLVGAGSPIPVPGSGDQLHPFEPHPEYRYLTDRKHPGEVLAFDPRDGWTLFAPEVTEDERVWTGAGPRGARPLAELQAWMARRADGPCAILGGLDRQGDETLAARLREQLRAIRRAKDGVELERMRRAARATEAGFALLPELARPGLTERRIRIELEAEFLRAGAEAVAYDTIVASGPNAAVLHFAPTGRALGSDELLLVDAGARIEGYCADVSRTYVSTSEQRALYDVVLEAQRGAIAACRPGAAYREIHLGTCARLARGLVDFGLLRGAPEGLVERDAHALFFPHGIGHMVGLGVRDGDSAPTRPRIERPGLRFLRLDCDLEPGYVVTIEPGIYVIPALLCRPEIRERYADCVDWERVDGMLDFGGIRIEDNVLVTERDPEVLTAAIPK